MFAVNGPGSDAVILRPFTAVCACVVARDGCDTVEVAYLIEAVSLSALIARTNAPAESNVPTTETISEVEPTSNDSVPPASSPLTPAALYPVTSY